MPAKKAFVLRIDPEMLRLIERWAADEFRSTNGQIEWILTRALKEAHRWKPPPSEDTVGKDKLKD